MEIEAVVAGHICLDIIPDLSGLDPARLETIFTPGHMTMVGAAAFSSGGAVSNTGLALNRLGVPTRLLGKVGDDIFGRAVQEIARQFLNGRDPGLVVDRGVGTAYTIIINPPGIDRIFFHHPAANDRFDSRDIPYDEIAGARLFHFGYPSVMRRMSENQGAELVKMFQQIKDQGLSTSLDMAFPDPDSPGGQADWRAILAASLPFVDIFAPSLDELLFMLQSELYAELFQASQGNILSLVTPALLSSLGQELLDLGARILVIKLGDQGLYLKTTSASQIATMGRAAPADSVAWADRELWAPCFKAQVVGTTGAGDATIAGFLAGLLHGLAAEDCVTAAVAVGACSVEASDALCGLRSWDDTLQRVETGWERLDLRLNAQGWVWDAGLSLWKKQSEG